MTHLQKIVLDTVNRYCSATSGFTTKGLADFIGRQPGSESNHQHSELIGRELRGLERIGQVRRMDSGKPIVWCKGA